MFRPGPPLDRQELPERFTLHDVEIDLDAARARRSGEPIPLEPKAFDLLLLLAANPGRVIEKQEIFERIWPDAVVTDNALARVVAHLRRELGDDAEAPRFVETVRTRGYRFLPMLRVPAGSGAPAAPARRGGRRRLVPVALAVGFAALAALAAWRLWPAGRSAAPSPWSPTPVQRTFALGYQGGADFSPDGSQIVYSSDAAGGLQLFVEPLGGGQSLQLTRGGGPKIDAAWSPDGRYIAYRDLDRKGIWLIPPTGGPARQVVAFGSQPAWFPDGRRLVFSSPGRPTLGAAEWPATYLSTLSLVEIDTNRVTPLTVPDSEWGGHGMPAVSPDGATVYFATGRGRGGGALWRVAAAGGAPERLIPLGTEPERSSPSFWYDPTPLPSGDALLALEKGAARRLVRIALDGSGRIEPVVEALPSGASELVLARGGQRLVFNDTRSRSSIEEVALVGGVEVEGPPRALAAASATRALTPRYSPDSARLFFYRRQPGARESVVVVTRATGETRALAPEAEPGAAWLGPTRLAVGALGGGIEIDLETGRRVEGPAARGADEVLGRVSPTVIAYASREGWIVYTAAATGSSSELFFGDLERGVTRQLTSTGRSAGFPALSRDERWVAFQVADTEGAENEIWRVPVAGGPAERLPSERGVSWLGGFAPDGSAVVYAAHRHGEWRLAIAGPGRPERLLDVPPETSGYLRWPDWSPDGRHLAYERMHYESSLWTIDLPPSPWRLR